MLFSKVKSAENTAEKDESTAENETEDENAVSASSYLAFGPYISAALIGYIVFFDTIYYLANLYLELF